MKLPPVRIRKDLTRITIDDNYITFHSVSGLEILFRRDEFHTIADNVVHIELAYEDMKKEDKWTIF